MEEAMSRIRLRAPVVAAVAIAVTVLVASQGRAEMGKNESCPCLFDPAFWTQAAFLDKLNSKDRVEENCSGITLDRSTRKTLSLVGSKPLGLGVVLEVAHDTGSDGFKADSFCKVSWTVTSSSGEGAAINFNEQISFDVTHYEVIADPMSPYKDLVSTIPSMNAGPVSIKACEADLLKIAQSYQVNCKFD
jgi:hypothetical protein